MNLINKVLLVSVLLCCNDALANNIQAKPLTVPPNLSLYRYEGNFYPSKIVNPNKFQGYFGKIKYLNPVHISHQIYHDENRAQYGPTAGEYKLATNVQVQPLSQTSSSGKRVESGLVEERNLKLDAMLGGGKHSIDKQDRVPSKINSVTRHYHDIYLKMKSPQDLVFGHVLDWPGTAEKRIAKINENQFKGQVIWADRKGGYGEHYWDLAQGAL